MRMFWMVAIGLLSATTGCTSLSLERHTLSQIQSSGEYRYQATLDCLATVAANGNALPSYYLLSSGTTKITDTAMVNSATVWTRALGSFLHGREARATVSRNPE